MFSLARFSPAVRLLSRGPRTIIRSVSTPATPAEAKVDPDVFTSPQQASAELPILPYFVHRTAGQQLPVYHERRRGGNLLETRVQKITGRVEALKKDLQLELNIPNDKIVISPVNRHIVIKGWWKKEVAAFLEKQRF